MLTWNEQRSGLINTDVAFWGALMPLNWKEFQVRLCKNKPHSFLPLVVQFVAEHMKNLFSFLFSRASSWSPQMSVLLASSKQNTNCVKVSLCKQINYKSGVKRRTILQKWWIFLSQVSHKQGLLTLDTFVVHFDVRLVFNTNTFMFDSCWSFITNQQNPIRFSGIIRKNVI